MRAIIIDNFLKRRIAELTRLRIRQDFQIPDIFPNSSGSFMDIHQVKCAGKVLKGMARIDTIMALNDVPPLLWILYTFPNISFGRVHT